MKLCKIFSMRNIFSQVLQGKKGTAKQEKDISPLICLSGFWDS